MNLNNVLAKAQRMMLDENFNRDVERAARAQRGQNNQDDFSAMEDAIFGVSSPSTQGYGKVPIPENVNYTNTPSMQGVKIIKEVKEPKTMANSKLPAAILESFQKTPSPVDAFDIDTINAQLHFQEDTPVQQVAKQPVREQQVHQAQQPQYVPQGGGQIDYNYLKYIINECIKENMKGKLNESAGGTIVGMKIAPGNKFQFLDSKGNLYEAQLTLKKKAGK